MFCVIWQKSEGLGAQAKWREVYYCSVVYSYTFPFKNAVVLLQLYVEFVHTVSPYLTINMADALCRNRY